MELVVNTYNSLKFVHVLSAVVWVGGACTLQAFAIRISGSGEGTRMAAFAKDLLDARHELGAARLEEIAVGFVMAFIASALVVRPFLEYVRRNGFAPFAWYRIVLGVVLLIAIYALAAA